MVINLAAPKGNKYASGGRREGAGRNPDWLKEQTRGIVKKDKLVERLALIANGGLIDQPLTNGEIIPLPAPVAEQRKAILDLLDRGFGKVTQPVSGEDGGPLTIKVVSYSGNNNPA